jgi:hypothetical protein
MFPGHDSGVAEGQCISATLHTHRLHRPSAERQLCARLPAQHPNRLSDNGGSFEIGCDHALAPATPEPPETRRPQPTRYAPPEPAK